MPDQRPFSPALRIVLALLAQPGVAGAVVADLHHLRAAEGLARHLRRRGHADLSAPHAAEAREVRARLEGRLGTLALQAGASEAGSRAAAAGVLAHLLDQPAVNTLSLMDHAADLHGPVEAGRRHDLAEAALNGRLPGLLAELQNRRAPTDHRSLHEQLRDLHPGELLAMHAGGLLDLQGGA